MSKRIVGAIVLLGIIAIVGLTGLTRSESSADPLVLADRQAVGFRYQIIAEDEQILRIQLDYDTGSVPGILAYKSAVVQRAAQYAATHLTQPFEVDVTLTHPISPEEFEDLVQSYHLQPTDFVVRTVHVDGHRETISGAFAGTTPVDISQEVQDAIDGMLRSYSDPSAPAPDDNTPSGANPVNPITVRGVVAFRANLLGSYYTDLAIDTSIFLVDALEAELKDEAVAIRPGQERFNVMYTPRSLYWFLEDLGLVQP